MSQPPDACMTNEQGRYWCVSWSNATRQFESEPVSAKQPARRRAQPQPEYGPLPPLRVFMSGMGVQSVAAKVLATQGKINYQHSVFCNVSNDSESPATLEYYHKYALPFAQANGLTLTELRYIRRDGAEDSILKRLTRPGGRSIGIPVRMKNGAPGRRSCTVDFKIRRTDRWLRQQGAKRRGAVLESSRVGGVYQQQARGAWARSRLFHCQRRATSNGRQRTRAACAVRG